MVGGLNKHIYNKFCPVCELEFGVNEGYKLVSRVKYHLGCDPSHIKVLRRL
jgi:hypothetical protein